MESFCFFCLVCRFDTLRGCGMASQPLPQHIVALHNGGLEVCPVVALDVVPRSVNLHVLHLLAVLPNGGKKRKFK